MNVSEDDADTFILMLWSILETVSYPASVFERECPACAGVRDTINAGSTDSRTNDSQKPVKSPLIDEAEPTSSRYTDFGNAVAKEFDFWMNLMAFRRSLA